MKATTVFWFVIAGDSNRRGDSGLRRADAVVRLGRVGVPHDQGRAAAARGVPALQRLRHRQGRTRAQGKLHRYSVCTSCFLFFHAPPVRTSSGWQVGPTRRMLIMNNLALPIEKFHVFGTSERASISCFVPSRVCESVVSIGRWNSKISASVSH